MANKFTNLDTSLFTLGGTDFLEKVENMRFNAEAMLDLCRGVAQRYGAKKGVKKEFTFSCDFLQHVSNTCASGLTLSLFSLDGSDFYSEIDSFDLDVTTETVFTDGAADLWRWIQAVGTDYRSSGSKFISSNADFMELLMQSNVTDIEVTTLITVAGIQLSLPMILSSSEHSIQGGAAQVENWTLEKNGTPTLVTGDALLAEILTGDAYLSWAADSEAGAYSGNAIVTSAKLSVQNAALVKSSYEFANQGQPNFTPA